MSQIKVDTITNGAGTGAPNFPNSISVAGTAISFPATRTDWNNTTAINGVVGQLAWKNYGNNHTIFDASASTSPTGTAVGNTDSQIAWAGSYPTLMGWNGVNTYGVRVDSARVADSAGAPAHEAVGSVSFLLQYPASTTDLYPGSNWSGSLLRYAGMYGVVQSWGILAWHNVAPAGTWRVTGGVVFGASSNYRATTFIRIA